MDCLFWKYVHTTQSPPLQIIETSTVSLLEFNIYSYSFPGLWQLCVCMGPTLWQFPWFVATLKNCHKPNPLYMAYISAGDRPPPPRMTRNRAATNYIAYISHSELWQLSYEVWHFWSRGGATLKICQKKTPWKRMKYIYHGIEIWRGHDLFERCWLVETREVILGCKQTRFICHINICDNLII